MKHDSEQSMMFHLLSRIDYNKTWEEIEHDLGYDLGDYYFKTEGANRVAINLAKHIWAELNGFRFQNQKHKE